MTIHPDAHTPLEAFAYTLADDEFYAPLSQVVNAGRTYTPSNMPAGWTAAHHGLWTTWSPAALSLPEQGWKVHVSARSERAASVLDTVAAVCTAEGVSFKHLRAELYFLYLHHKHGPRQQAGKFCAAYPGGEDAARVLLERLEHALAGEAGPYVLTDRRFRDSRTVHYRWGAYGMRGRTRPDGLRDFTVRTPDGREARDERRTSFVLPDGIDDPFAQPQPAARSGPVTLGGYQVVRAIRPSNAGGTYEGREPATGRRVFIKEARAHNGLTWDGSDAQERLRHEHAMLTAIHAAAPGLSPEPLAHFREWEHEFLVTEFVEGQSLHHWAAAHSPLIRGRSAADRIPAYYERCERILDALERALAALHELGYRFGDVSPGNVLVTADDGVRLIDFEAASHRDAPRVPLATEDYVMPDTSDDPFAQDAYAVCAIALALLLPLHPVLRRSPGNAGLLRRDLSQHAPVPERLWRRACPTPEPEPPVAEPDLEALAERLRDGLLAMADAAHPDRVFPTIPRGYEANALGVAYGTAGVLHALEATGAQVPDPVVARFRRDALERCRELPPGLHVGAAGVAWVLQELGHADEALTLLDAAGRHAVLRRSTTIAEGVAGVGLARLFVHHQLGDARSLDRASAAGDAILATDELEPTLGAADTIGLLHGRAGLALFLRYLARDTGDERYQRAGRRLLHVELDHAIDADGGTLAFADPRAQFKASPYLASGAAGIALVMARYVDDERVAAALPRVLAGLDTRCTLLPGLYDGLAGLALAVAGCGDAALARSLASGLAKYAIPHGSGVRVLGDRSARRFSADLSSGGAGVLLGLHAALEGGVDSLFTLDRVHSLTP